MTNRQWVDGEPLGRPVDQWAIHLDEDHLLQPFVNVGSTKVAGYFVAIRHRGEPDRPWCIGSVILKGHGKDGRPEWDLVSEDPLTLTPSILQRQGDLCTHHGWVTAGKWVPA